VENDRLVRRTVPVLASEEAPGPSEGWRAVQMQWLVSARLKVHYKASQATDLSSLCSDNKQQISERE